jgi:hypothetical protein
VDILRSAWVGPWLPGLPAMSPAEQPEKLVQLMAAATAPSSHGDGTVLNLSSLLQFPGFRRLLSDSRNAALIG